MMTIKLEANWFSLPRAARSKRLNFPENIGQTNHISIVLS